MTISSSEQLPARSPIPLMVHSTCRAPASMAASELATASPKSSWQCTLTTAQSPSDRATWPMIAPYSHGVGDIHRPRSRRHHCSADFLQVLGFGARAVFRGKLHIVGVAAGQLHGCNRFLQNLFLRFLQLILEVYGAGGDERVDARPFGMLQRLGGPFHVQ